MAVCLRIIIDHSRTEEELLSLCNLIPEDKELKRFLKDLEFYEDKIGTAPIGGYKLWEKDYSNNKEFKELLTDGAVNIRNNVFSIRIARKGYVIDHWTKLDYFCDDMNLQRIFRKLIEKLAFLFDSAVFIIAADSAYKTEIFDCLIYEANDIHAVLKLIKNENIRVSETIEGIKRHTEGRYYETDACYIEKL